MESRLAVEPRIRKRNEMANSRKWDRSLYALTLGLLCLLGWMVSRTPQTFLGSAGGKGSRAVPAQWTGAPAQVPPRTRQRIVEAYGKLPLYFVENRGQLDARVAYYIQGRDTSVYFTRGARQENGISRWTVYFFSFLTAYSAVR